MKSRTDLLILSILNKEGIDCIAKAITAKELPIEDLGVKLNTIQKRLRVLTSLGYIALGYRDFQANTYFITELGKMTLEESK